MIKKKNIINCTFLFEKLYGFVRLKMYGFFFNKALATLYMQMIILGLSEIVPRIDKDEAPDSIFSCFIKVGPLNTWRYRIRNGVTFVTLLTFVKYLFFFYF